MSQLKGDDSINEAGSGFDDANKKCWTWVAASGLTAIIKGGSVGRVIHSVLGTLDRPLYPHCSGGSGRRLVPIVYGERVHQ